MRTAERNQQQALRGENSAFVLSCGALTGAFIRPSICVPGEKERRYAGNTAVGPARRIESFGQTADSKTFSTATGRPQLTSLGHGRYT